LILSGSFDFALHRIDFSTLGTEPVSEVMIPETFQRAERSVALAAEQRGLQLFLALAAVNERTLCHFAYSFPAGCEIRFPVARSGAINL
jgi:hypothetical protein